MINEDALEEAFNRHQALLEAAGIEENPEQRKEEGKIPAIAEIFNALGVDNVAVHALTLAHLEEYANSKDLDAEDYRRKVQEDPLNVPPNPLSVYGLAFVQGIQLGIIAARVEQENVLLKFD